jgi:hypothetical protein
MFDRFGYAVDDPFRLPDNLAFSGITIRKMGAMDRIDAMRVFARVVERGSFVRAAEDLRLPASTATDAVKQLEARATPVFRRLSGSGTVDERRRPLRRFCACQHRSIARPGATFLVIRRATGISRRTSEPEV